MFLNTELKLCQDSLLKKTMKVFHGLVLFGATCLPAVQAQTTVAISDVPLLALKNAPGVIMMTMSRDHRLFYAAYDDTSDIDGDGVVDVGFKPNITYYGNFVSDRCYDYVASGTANQSVFRPVLLAVNGSCKISGVQRWHGNWLNWATTSRMDALRRVLYGGYRVVDNATTSSTTNSSTTLQGAFIPKDSHVWGKEYRPGRDTYDITNYTPLASPTSNVNTPNGAQHLFTVVSPGGNSGYPFLSATTAPALRLITNADKTKERIWYWASADVAQGIASSPANFTKGGGRTSVTAADYYLRVEACVPINGVRESGCTSYPIGSTTPTTWKPTGVLHDYALNDQLKFGLLTGSYQKNYSGGVVRRNIQSFNNEILSSTGQFDTANDGIARTIDRITIHGWGGSQYDCGYRTDANRSEGACKSWGAPVAEMMYEGLRYLSGKSAATSAFLYTNTGSADNAMGFAAPPAWQNPFRAKSVGGNPICSRPVQMVIADPLTSFDSDQLPGAYYSPTSGWGTALSSNDLTGLNVTSEADAIWTAESLGTRNVFIGQSSSTNYDGNPTVKPASSFAPLRGHAPDETQSQGSFHAASVARFGKKTGISIGAPTGTPVVPAQNATVDTLAIALGSRTPKIEFPNPNGGKVSIVPLSKAIYTSNKNPGQYQPTGAITGFYYSDYSANSVSVVVNFSDSDQGTDNETDAQARYDISISGSQLTIQMTQLDPYPGGIQSELGYVISGTTKDGLYLDMRSNTSSSGAMAAGTVYYLDTLTTTTPPQSPKSVSSPLNTQVLPTYGTTTTRTFTLATNAGTSSYIPYDPLWYAAKYAGPVDADGNTVVDASGNPANYFKISNPAQLPAQMGKAFRAAAALAAVASTSVVGVGQRSLGTAAIYQANYDSLTWSSRLYAYPLDSAGALSDQPIWEASSLIPASPSSRSNIYLGRGGSSTPLNLLPSTYASLTTAEKTDFGSNNVFNYLLGDKTGEERNGGTYRNRGITSATNTTTTALAKSTYGSVLGDIVNSDPQVITKKDYGYAASDASYTAFWSGISSEMIAVGSNDGFFHIFDATPTATGGGELLAFMPQAARTNIKALASAAYQHKNFVDGSIAVGHAKIRTPSDSNVTWRSIVIGTGGVGAQTVFAIDATSSSFSASSILWEINQNSTGVVNNSLATPASTLGNIVGRPVIGKLSNGTWVAIFGNGFNSPAGTANLYVVRLNDGVILKVLDTNNSLTANGMGNIEVLRKKTGDQDTIEYVYGSDYKGNIWRFDLSPSSISSWSSSPALIYKTPTGRPITSEIRVLSAPNTTKTSGGNMIYFGTGSYLNSNDPANTTVQALYGIYDNLLHNLSATPYVAETDLLSMGIQMTAGADTRTTQSATQDFSGNSTMIWYNYSGSSASEPGKKGWVVPLSGTNVAAGERVIAPPVRYYVPGTVDAILFTSIVPSTDDCQSGLDAWITAIDTATGGYSKAFNDLAPNSVKIAGGSPRGVFVLQDGSAPALYISQTIFSGTVPTNTFTTSTGASQSVTINGITGTTRIISIKLNYPSVVYKSTRQIWKQLK